MKVTSLISVRLFHLILYWIHRYKVNENQFKVLFILKKYVDFTLKRVRNFFFTIIACNIIILCKMALKNYSYFYLLAFCVYNFFFKILFRHIWLHLINSPSQGVPYISTFKQLIWMSTTLKNFYEIREKKILILIRAGFRRVHFEVGGKITSLSKTR